ncbi:YfhO family protein [Chloroflexi bacterium TSY]|nr:YfhO family protein [Chloroflexi bacterium TSY]
MNGAAWLPWALLILTTEPSTIKSRTKLQPLLIHVSLLSLCVALMILAGHTQTAYINLFGIGVWIIWPWRYPKPFSNLTLLFQRVSNQLIIYVSAILLAAIISATQLLPTFELSAYGLRSGGLSYFDATSFSLQPLRLLWTIFPTYGLIDLSVVFGPAFTEFVGYIGVSGLALAAWGAWKGRGAARIFALLFALVGFALALGRWNPFYFPLYYLVPGFNLFRTPARWLMLYTLGMAILAGIGWDRAMKPGYRMLGICLVALELLVAARGLPHTYTTAPQAVYDVRTAPAHLLTDPVRTELDPAAAGRFLSMSTITFDPGDMGDYHRILRAGSIPQLDQTAFDELIIALKSQEILAPNLPLLWRVPAVDGFDGGVLPLQRYIQAMELFVSPEYLVQDGRLREQVKVIPQSHLLSLFNVQYVITDKVHDVWFEGIYYDRQLGAWLGTHSAESMLESIVVDVPLPFEATRLDLLGYVDGSQKTIERLANENVPVSAIQLWSRRRVSVEQPVFNQISGSGESKTITDIVVSTETLTDELDTLNEPYILFAGGQSGAHLADGVLESILGKTSKVQVAYRDIEDGIQEYVVQIDLKRPILPAAIEIKQSTESLPLLIRAVTLVDERTGMFVPLTISDRGRFQLVHGGDVKIYENLDLLPRAYLAHEGIGVANQSAALAELQRYLENLSDRAGDFAGSTGELAVVEGIASFVSQQKPTDKAQIVTYTPERIEIHTTTQDSALLVLSDTYYPGWRATIDGQTTPIYPTNLLFRGVIVPSGEHTVVFTYRPNGWWWGVWLSLAGLFTCFFFCGAGCAMYVFPKLKHTPSVQQFQIGNGTVVGQVTVTPQISHFAAEVHARWVVK